jgi:hypothetical protein
VNRRLLDILVPVGYVIAILIAVFIGNDEWVGIIASIGALLVAVYYVGLRPSVKKADPTT